MLGVRKAGHSRHTESFLVVLLAPRLAMTGDQVHRIFNSRECGILIRFGSPSLNRPCPMRARMIACRCVSLTVRSLCNLLFNLRSQNSRSSAGTGLTVSAARARGATSLAR